MNTDFTAILAILALVSGLIWGVDHWLFAKKRAQQAGGEDTSADKRKEPILVEYSRFLFPVFIIVLVVRGFIAEPFKIPSGSMLPTLEVGDFILVNKFSYGLRLPLGYYKLIDLGSPERGDVIVFRYPEDPSIDYIKRVVGVPGDRIVYRNKELFINGERIPHQELQAYPQDPRFMELRETMGDTSYNIMIAGRYNFMDQAQEWTVPEGEYFVLGDNRDNSRDSRYWGFVKDEYLKGRAFFIWFSKNDGFDIKWSRIGTIIQ